MSLAIGMREYVYTCDHVCVNFYVCILGFYANTFTQDIFALEFAEFILTHIVFFLFVGTGIQ